MTVSKKLPIRVGSRIKPYYTTEVHTQEYGALTITVLTSLDSATYIVVATYVEGSNNTSVYYLESLAEVECLPEDIKYYVKEIAKVIREEQ